jgi:hypothetical protein
LLDVYFVDANESDFNVALLTSLYFLAKHFGATTQTTTAVRIPTAAIPPMAIPAIAPADKRDESNGTSFFWDCDGAMEKEVFGGIPVDSIGRPVALAGRIVDEAVAEAEAVCVGDGTYRKWME